MEQQKKQQKKKKNSLKPVYKPYYKGEVLSKEVYKRSGKIAGIYLVSMFLYLMLGTALNFQNTFLRVITNLLLALAAMTLMYMDGARAGDLDTSFAEIIWNRKEEGKTVDASDAKRCFNRYKGVVTALLGALPFLLISLLYGILAKPQVYALQTLPSWLGGFQQTEEVMLPLSYYYQDLSFSVLDGLRMITRLLIYPFVNMVTADNIRALLWMDRLSCLIIMIPAAGYMIGYALGPYSRALTHGSIAASNRRSARKRKKEIKARQNKSKELI